MTSLFRHLPGVFRVAAALQAACVARAAGAEIQVQGTNYAHPVVIPAGLGDALAVSAGRDHLLVLRGDGTVLGLGCNDNGRATPPTGLTGVVAVAAGIYDSLALKSDGTVAAWGYGGEGMTKPPAGLGGVVAVAAGGFHNLALLRDGSVVGWGLNANGRATPPRGLTGVTAIAAGRDHSLALRRDGTVASWGQNDSGQTKVPPGLAGVIAIAAGNAHSLALKSDGTVAAWGSDSQGQCDVPAGLTNVVEIAGGNGYSLALTRDGRIIGWGDNSSGQTSFSQAGFSAISAGGTESVALTSGNGLHITTPPLSQATGAGQTVRFTVAATGPGKLSYQWYFNGRPVEWATNSVLSVNGAVLANAGDYSVVVSDAGSGVEVSSGVAALMVWGTYVLKKIEMAEGGSVALTIGDAGGSPLTSYDFTGWSLQYSKNLFDWAEIPLQGSVAGGDFLAGDNPGHDKIRFYRLKGAQ